MQDLTVGEPAFGGPQRLLSREELYDLVWQTPMSQLAKRFGLSDVGLKKVCRKHDIPTPPLGYWAKRAHGKRVFQPQLPATKGPQKLVLSVVPLAVEQPELQAEQAKALKRASEFPPIQVPSDQPANLHPVAVRTAKALRAAKVDQHGLKRVSEPGAVAVVVGNASVDRVLRIIHAFAAASEKRGFSLTEHPEGVQVLVEGTPVLWQLKETTDQTPHVPTKEELNWLARREADRAKYPYLYSSRSEGPVFRSWDQVLSGRLSMTLRDPSAPRWGRKDLIGHWCDRRNKLLEDYLDQAMATLATGALAIRHRHAEESEKERQRLEDLERQRLERARRDRAEKRRHFLFTKADEHERYRKLVALAEFLEQNREQESLGQETRLLRELREITGAMRRDLDLAAMNAEADRLQLYADETLPAKEPE
ncbi:MAG: hypothetical protein JJ959_08105 [Nisaea sp.]|uniref:hypothetical protein n=1 Tax=Nisaea sp. TaxID=2024842 RepID=UPI001B2DB216|nr:hypothetical protein [Nisaea sp.]MBO6560484.1 hypothetical protein [Nisaea sp.]